MEVNLSLVNRGKGQLWNHCSERHCILGMVCKAAGVEDFEMNHRLSIVFKHQETKDVAGKVIKTIPAKALPEELTSFFEEEKGWAKRTGMKGSRRYKVNDLGNTVALLNDSGPGQVPQAMWEAKVLEVLAYGDIQAIWEKEINVSEV